MFMNEYDVEDAVRTYDRTDLPNRRTAALTLAALVDWTNRNSDGWPYWSKPSRAAAKLTTLVYGGTYADQCAREETDATRAELVAALRPVKSFLTRHGVAHDVVIYQTEAGR